MYVRTRRNIGILWTRLLEFMGQSEYRLMMGVEILRARTMFSELLFASVAIFWISQKMSGPVSKGFLLCSHVLTTTILGPWNIEAVEEEFCDIFWVCNFMY